jgi:uncharacterized protein YodC (DUF2158 family)
MAHFKSGDLVVLKSGGPTMTIDTVNTDIFDDDKITGVLCVWFVGELMQRVRFDHRALKLARSEPMEAQPLDGAAMAAAVIRRVAKTPPPHEAEILAPEVCVTEVGVAASTAEAEMSETVEPTAATNGATVPDPANPPPVAAADTGDYAAVLDSMVGAMNAAADLMGTDRPVRRARTTVRASARNKTTH